MCVFWLLYQSAVPPSLSLSAGLLIPWDTATLKLVQLMPLQWSINVQMKEIHMFLTLNQNLEMIKRSEEGMSKAEIFWKLGLRYYLAKSWMQRKSFFWRKLKVLFQWKIRNWNSLTADMEKVFSGLDRKSNQNLIQRKALKLFNYVKFKKVKEDA